MTASPNRFAPRGPQDLADLARRQPLAWVCSRGPAGLLATPLPLVPKLAPDGRVVAVEGHFARSNAHVDALRADGRATVLWLGVQGYVSPSWMADRTQAPTWNYASAQLQVDVRLVEDPDAIIAHLRELTGRQEADRPRAWTIDEMGARLASLARRVIAFRAEVVASREKYKLGQDERDDVYADILAGLDAQPDAALPAWMRRFNPGRG
ncbi:MAG: FMN-binding negative transcriptional regulator [Burkholderiales bacterium]|nr:FMN-binding negative transcriptional regulator [Burkholderiales bacterium]